MATKPRICFVSMEVYPNLRPGVSEEAGGAGFQILEIARELRKQGVPVSLVVGDYGQPFREEIEGFEVLRSNQVAYNKSVTRGLANLWRLFKAMRAARARHYILRSDRFLSFFVVVFARLLGARYTFMVASRPHCLRQGLENLSRTFRTLFLFSVKLAHRITVQSQEQQELFRANFGVEAPILPNGIQVPPLENPRHEAPFDISWIASFKIAKRADVFLKLIDLLPERRFLVVGGPGPDKAYSQELIDQMKQRPNVEFRGFVPPNQIAGVYREARLFLNTSDWEGFPNGFLYAWSLGIPACSLKVDPDGVVMKKDLGIVIDDVPELARRLDELLEQPERLAEMAARCHEHVREAHGIDRTARRLLEILP
jgi:glycosyltransferase involved in cell wall biosynthesis